MTSLDNARYHLRIDGTEHDAEIEQKLMLARAIVSDYIGNSYQPNGDYIGNSYQSNGDIEDAAVMLVLGELWLNRESSTADVLSPAVRSLLERQRVQALA